MHFEWDEQKNQLNIEKHGLDFNDAKKLFEHTILKFEDTRINYGELRTVGFAMQQGRLMNVVYTERNNAIRIISFRRANSREVVLYEKAIKDRLG